MKKEHWICGGAGCEAPLFRRSFWLDRTERFQSARLEICGLGYFLFYINGKRISDQELMPAMTDYASVLGCETTYPVWEERSAHRCRYLSFDLLPYLKAGENVLAVRLGNGWYHQTERIAEGKFVFGLPKLWFELTLTDADGRQEWIESDRQTLWHPGGLLKNNLFLGEVRDLRKEPEGWQYPGADLSGWKPAQPVHAPETLLEEQTCPPDRVIRKLYPILIGEYDGRKIYDCRENIAGRVVLSCLGKKGECITVRHAEELAADGTLDFESAGGSDQLQQDHYICDGRIQTLHPLFCWHGFRYFETEGPCEVLCAEVIHTDVAVTSSFSCSDPVLNWLYEAYIRTQLDNYHGCVPSDCPHRERLGYTGDGQLTAETAMLLLYTKELYRTAREKKPDIFRIPRHFWAGEEDPAAGAAQCIRFRSHGQKFMGTTACLCRAMTRSCAGSIIWMPTVKRDLWSAKRRAAGVWATGASRHQRKRSSCRRHLSIRSTTCMDCRK